MGDMEQALRLNGIPVAADRIALLETYLDMLDDWNQRMDLTSVPKDAMIPRHFVDSLLPLKETDDFPNGISLIDVGTGAGFPGLALAVARPDMQVTLLEAQGKRCQFLQAVADQLQLTNVRILQGRAEVLGREAEHREQYDRGVARAVASLNVLCEYLLPFVKVGGMMLCWKGPAVTEEWEDGEAAANALGGKLMPAQAWTIPGAEGEKYFVRCLKQEKTVSQYPRKNGIPAKRPIKKTQK